MRTRLLPCFGMALLAWNCAAQENQANDVETAGTAKVTAHSDGLHGYIGFSATRPPAQSEFSAGMGFYSAVWPLIDQPLAGFQIGLAGSWITPDNSDNKDKPLAPEGTLARTWRERGPTWSSVFQTVEGGLGYWAGNHFRYGPPKFSMNATPQCYDYEIGSPGWSFFYSNKALPDHRLGIAQAEQPAVDSSRCATVSGKSQRPIPGLHVDGLALYRSHHGRSAHGRPELDVLPERGQLQGPDRLLHSGDLEQDRQAVQLSVHLWTRTRCSAGRDGRRRHGDQHRALFRGQGCATGWFIRRSPNCSSRWTSGGEASLCRT